MFDKTIQNFTFNLFYPNVFSRFTLFTFNLNPDLICPKSTLSPVSTQFPYKNAILKNDLG